MGKRIALTIIPEPPRGSRLTLVAKDGFGGPFIDGSIKRLNTYDCGNCGRTLARQVRRADLQDTVLVCPSCGEHNDGTPRRGGRRGQAGVANSQARRSGGSSHSP